MNILKEWLIRVATIVGIVMFIHVMFYLGEMAYVAGGLFAL